MRERDASFRPHRGSQPGLDTFGDRHSPAESSGPEASGDLSQKFKYSTHTLHAQMANSARPSHILLARYSACETSLALPSPPPPPFPPFLSARVFTWRTYSTISLSYFLIPIFLAHARSKLAARCSSLSFFVIRITLLFFLLSSFSPLSSVRKHLIFITASFLNSLISSRLAHPFFLFFA